MSFTCRLPYPHCLREGSRPRLHSWVKTGSVHSGPCQGVIGPASSTHASPWETRENPRTTKNAGFEGERRTTQSQNRKFTGSLGRRGSVVSLSPVESSFCRLVSLSPFRLRLFPSVERRGTDRDSKKRPCRQREVTHTCRP